MKKKRILGIAMILLVIGVSSVFAEVTARQKQQVEQDVSNLESAASSFASVVRDVTRKRELSSSDESRITNAATKFESAQNRLNSYAAVEVFNSDNSLMRRFEAASYTGTMAASQFNNWIAQIYR